MTLKEFKEWLNKFPDETIVEVAIQSTPSSWESHGPVVFKEFEANEEDMEGWEFVDFRDNKFTKETDHWYNKCFLRIGEVN